MKIVLTPIALAIILVATTTEAAMKKRVTFESNGKTLVGDLYLPDTYQDGQRLPGVVVTGAWTSVKEQMAGTYAVQIADRGYAALAFDFRGWGQSPDTVQFLEDPARKTADINAAVNFLATRPEVDRNRIGGLGVCASAGYMSDTALQNPHLKSVALVAPWLHNAEIVEATYGGKEDVSKLIQISREAQASTEPLILEAASATNDKAVMYQVPYYTETDRGLISEYDNKFNAASWEPWLTYNAIETADKLKKPTVLIHSEAAAIPQGAKEYARRMGDSAKIIWLDDITQFEFYDQPKAVKTSSDAVADHFKATLK
ncbi:hypothetical protein NKDENANG_03387 [Candidatus Entotheonellaceae bacterium PAL068K]